MSKSLLTAKIAGGAVLGTGAVAAGGYGIVEHFRSKESTDQSENQDTGSPNSDSPVVDNNQTQGNLEVSQPVPQEPSSDGTSKDPQPPQPSSDQKEQKEDSTTDNPGTPSLPDQSGVSTTETKPASEPSTTLNEAGQAEGGS